MCASELVAIAVEHIIEAIDPDARLVSIPRSKGDQEGEGATAFLSPRTVRAIAAWREAAGIERGPIFRRVNVRRSEEHTSELQSLMRISYAVFCLKKKKQQKKHKATTTDMK